MRDLHLVPLGVSPDRRAGASLYHQIHEGLAFCDTRRPPRIGRATPFDTGRRGGSRRRAKHGGRGLRAARGGGLRSLPGRRRHPGRRHRAGAAVAPGAQHLEESGRSPPGHVRRRPRECGARRTGSSSCRAVVSRIASWNPHCNSPVCSVVEKVLVSDASVLIDVDRGSLVEATYRLPFELAGPDLLYVREIVSHGADAMRSKRKRGWPRGDRRGTRRARAR